MDHTSERQAQIEQQKAAAALAYPALWSRVMAEWSADGEQDCAWLLFSANYLFRTGGLRWAIDPLTLRQRLPGAPAVDIAGLRSLSFVLLTHSHKDHLDLNLLSALRDAPIRWVVPDFLHQAVLEGAGLIPENVVTPRPLVPFELDGLTILPFDDLHWARQPAAGGETLRGVPAMGYCIEFKKKRWLFPGDIRTYDPGKLPALGPVDVVFAHLWLGRACAMLEQPPLLDDFCRFFAGLKPSRMVLTHLQESGRQAEDYWDTRHARLVSGWFNKNAPEVQVMVAYTGEKVLL